MRHSISMILLSAGVVLSLAGCQKDPSKNYLSGKAVRFSASSASAETRTAFSGEGTQKTQTDENNQTVGMTDEFGRKILTWERIDWKSGDQVMIASDNAKVLNSEQNFATYKVESVSTPESDNNVSEARVEEMDGDKELFFTDADSYTFWAVYPASAGVGSTLAGGTVDFTISNPEIAKTETITKGDKTLTVLQPKMDQALMLAKKENVTSETVDLEFYPAFTAFEFTLSTKEDDDLPVKTLVLSSGTTSPLAGTVTATLKSGATSGKGNSTYTVTKTGDGTLTYTFPDNTVISNTKYLTFTVFAPPQDVKGLTMKFSLGADGNNVQEGTLKYNGEDITFAGCKKHSLRGIAVKSGWEFKILNLTGDPDEWTDVDLDDVDNADYPEATQFEVSGANNGRYYSTAYVTVSDKDNKDDRQKWLMKNDATVTVKFKIMSPDGWNWLVVPCGDVTAFTITSNMEGNALTGPVSNTKTVGDETIATTTNVIFYITAKNPEDTATHELYFKTYVVDPNSGVVDQDTGEVDPDTLTMYSLDSETQLLEMRGYHYFYLNKTL